MFSISIPRQVDKLFCMLKTNTSPKDGEMRYVIIFEDEMIITINATSPREAIKRASENFSHLTGYSREKMAHIHSVHVCH